MNNAQFGLPRRLNNGLLLRWATLADTERLADFNFQHHNDEPGGYQETWLKDWTRVLMGGEHPTAGAGDFTVVVDDKKETKIVSSCVLISQTWSYDGVTFGCGRPELIATEESYRRQGLVRAQLDVIHAKSAARGESVQAITGIPWFYRQFGYEMAIDLGGSRILSPDKIARLPIDQEGKYRLRQAQFDDIADLRRLYDLNSKSSLLRCEREESIWQFEVQNALNTEVPLRYREIIETTSGQVAGYIDALKFPRMDTLREFALYPEFSLREVAFFVARKLRQRICDNGTKGEEPFKGINFVLGCCHPLYEALAVELGKPRPPYAWYIRVPDLSGFLLRIRPVIERRLAESVMAGYSGLLRLNFYKDSLALAFQEGTMTSIEPYKPSQFFDGDAFFPGRVFLQLLFGYRSLDELKYAFPDCFTESNDAAVLLPILFPKRPSNIIMLS